MKVKRVIIEDWQRFWMLALGTFVIAGSWLTTSSEVQLLRSTFLDGIRGAIFLAALTTGLYSWILIRCGRFLLALVGFGVVAIGLLFNPAR